MKNLSVIVLSLCCSLMLRSQENTSTTPATISVSGVATISLEADELEISLGVQEEGADAAEVMKSTREKMARIAAILKNRKDVKAIRTERINLNVRNSRAEAQYYLANQALRFTLSDMEAYDSILLELLDAGANTINRAQLKSSQSTQAYDKLLEQALQNAKEKAERMAKVYGQSVGKALFISDKPSGQGGGSVNYAYKASSEFSSIEPSIVGGNLELSRQVYVTFELN